MATGLAIAAILSATASGVAAVQQAESARAQGRQLEKQGDEAVRLADEANEERRKILVRTLGAVKARAAAAGFTQSGTPTIVSLSSITESVLARNRIKSAAEFTRSQLQSRADNVVQAGLIGAGTTILQSVSSITFAGSQAFAAASATATASPTTSSLGGGSGFGIQ